MPDPRFHRRAGPFSLAELAARIGAPPPEQGADKRVVAVANLDVAGPDDLAFLSDRRHAVAAALSQAGVVLTAPDLAAAAPASALVWATPQPALHFARAAAALHPEPESVPGVDPSARIDPSAQIDPSAEIGPFVVVGVGAVIGPGCVLAPHVVIGAQVVLGEDCRIGAGASIAFARLGARVAVLPGARIGQAGFGFTPGPKGLERTPQLGCVVIEDDVEIGANTTVDRGSLSDTIIRRGAKIDNLVQIGHAVQVGAHCALAAQTGLSGSAVIGDGVMLGGQVGIADHITIGGGARIAAQSGVHRDVPAGEVWGGSPAVPAIQWRRQAAFLALKTKR